ncbi:hypothetical protein EV201_3025 [Ancylomarina subtilis]|uniref:Uncharacterized protein n=1 Tax=Ancylomarina subtilis TaxID=1639035 RepID=A0A4Q7VAP2_9BACT|nr:hypothetical protein EV201_3025 [Ancylomarina subtilis]
MHSSVELCIFYILIGSLNKLFLVGLIKASE